MVLLIVVFCNWLFRSVNPANMCLQHTCKCCLLILESINLHVKYVYIYIYIYIFVLVAPAVSLPNIHRLTSPALAILLPNRKMSSLSLLSLLIVQTCMFIWIYFYCIIHWVSLQNIHLLHHPTQQRNKKCTNIMLNSLCKHICSCCLTGPCE